jgi:glycerol-3-phosphate acyltransferase PlsX
LRKKRRSSIAVACQLVGEGRAQAIVSAGNTGAVMAAAMKHLGRIPGVDRPALAAVLPNRSGRTVLLDVGANVVTKPHHLRQFAVMGHLYAQQVMGTASPRVGLLSVGEEEGKGTELTREVFRVLKGTGLNFVGNVEGRDVFAGTVDVVVCDGFVGNVVLKSCEATAHAMFKWLKAELTASPVRMLGAKLAKGAFRAVKDRASADSYGGCPLLGVGGVCIIAHGSSSPTAIKNAIRIAAEAVSHEVNPHIEEEIARHKITPPPSASGSESTAPVSARCWRCPACASSSVVPTPTNTVRRRCSASRAVVSSATAGRRLSECATASAERWSSAPTPSTTRSASRWR